MSIINLISTGVEHSDLGAIGSVKDVIAGVVRSDLKTRTWDAATYRYGFELASPHKIQSMGESVLVNGLCYSTSTDKRDQYLKVIFGKTFYTSGMFVVPKTAQASYCFKPMQSRSGMPYQDFCHGLHQTINRPCLFVALLHFKQIEATHIQYPPIYGENIFEHQDQYYSDLKLYFNQKYCLVVCAFANFSTDPRNTLKELEVVLYQNPLDVKNELNVHTHGIILNRTIRDVSTLFPEDVTHVVHLYNASSVVDEVVWGEVFVVNHVELF